MKVEKSKCAEVCFGIVHGGHPYSDNLLRQRCGPWRSCRKQRRLSLEAWNSSPQSLQSGRQAREAFEGQKPWREGGLHSVCSCFCKLIQADKQSKKDEAFLACLGTCCACLLSSCSQEKKRAFQQAKKKEEDVSRLCLFKYSQNKNSTLPGAVRSDFEQEAQAGRMRTNSTQHNLAKQHVFSKQEAQS